MSTDELGRAPVPHRDVPVEPRTSLNDRTLQRLEERQQELERNRAALRTEKEYLDAAINELSKELRPLREPGESSIAGMQAIGGLENVPYSGGAGPAFTIRGDGTIERSASTHSLSFEDGTKFPATAGIVCSPASFRAWQIGQGNQFEGLPFEQHPKMHQAYNRWNTMDSAYPGVDGNLRKGAVDVITWLGIGLEVPKESVQRGDLMQNWEWRKDKDGNGYWGGHSGYVTGVERDATGHVTRITVLSATGLIDLDHAIKPRTWSKKEVARFFDGVDGRRIYFGRMYGGSGSLEQRAAKDRELQGTMDNLRSQREALERVLSAQEFRGSLVGEVLQNRLPSSLPPRATANLASTLADGVVSGPERERIEGYVGRIPEMIPDTQLRERAAKIIGSELDRYRSQIGLHKLERQALRDLGRKEKSVKGFDWKLRQLHKQQRALDADRRLSNLEERRELKGEIARTQFLQSSAKLMIDASRVKDLRDTLETISHRLADQATFNGIDVIRGYLQKLSDEMLEEQRDLEVRFQLVKGEVEDYFEFGEETETR